MKWISIKSNQYLSDGEIADLWIVNADDYDDNDVSNGYRITNCVYKNKQWFWISKSWNGKFEILNEFNDKDIITHWMKIDLPTI